MLLTTYLLMLLDFATEMAVLFVNEGNIRGEFSTASRMVVVDMVNKISIERAIKYCECINEIFESNKDDLERIVSVVGGRFRDLQRGCQALGFQTIGIEFVRNSILHFKEPGVARQSKKYCQ